VILFPRVWMWLIAGLGNPGPDYENTRHNMGFMALDTLARRWKISVRNEDKHLLLGKGRRGGEEIILAKPFAYMNRSGDILAPLSDREGIEVSRILVLVDDLDLPLGTLRYRPWGGTAGHRGMESMVQHLGTDRFRRIRLGIGRPGDETEESDYVLSHFSSDEMPLVGKTVAAAVDLTEKVVFEGRTAPITIRLMQD
jgi:PTH1 family peptidyl-tRNA hydrolase